MPRAIYSNTYINHLFTLKFKMIMQPMSSFQHNTLSFCTCSPPNILSITRKNMLTKKRHYIHASCDVIETSKADASNVSPNTDFMFSDLVTSRWQCVTINTIGQNSYHFIRSSPGKYFRSTLFRFWVFFFVFINDLPMYWRSPTLSYLLTTQSALSRSFWPW